MTKRRFPDEWEPHRATWIAWPHEKSDWPEKFEAIPWVYTEIVRLLSRSELVEIIVFNGTQRSQAEARLSAVGVKPEKYRFHELETNRSWLRDSLATAVLVDEKRLEWIGWRFNAWAKYENFVADQSVPKFVAKISDCPLVPAIKSDGTPLVLEGGAIDTDGQGTLLTTEECLLSEIQERNPGLSRKDYEELFHTYLGISKTIWLERGISGDDTHGHIDDLARFVSPGVVLVAEERDPLNINFKPLKDARKRLELAQDAQGRSLEVVGLPMPEPITFESQELPASYLNFYIANTVVLVPTFNDQSDLHALSLLGKIFPTREVIGVHAVDLILGLGTLHCLTQQEPKVK